jgi:hypothetical protein
VERGKTFELAGSLTGGYRGAWLGSEDLSGLVDNEDTAGGTGRGLLEIDGGNQGGAGITEERIWEVILLLEGGVGLGRILRETINRKASRGKIGILISEVAGLLGA